MLVTPSRSPLTENPATAVAIQRKDLRREQAGLSLRTMSHQWTHSCMFPSSVSLARDSWIMDHTYDTLYLLHSNGVWTGKIEALRGGETNSRLHPDEVSDE
jgi:hypothetical protein